MIYYVIDPNYFVLACPSNRSAGSNSGVNLKFHEKGWGIAMYKLSDTSIKRVSVWPKGGFIPFCGIFGLKGGSDFLRWGCVGLILKGGDFEEFHKK